MYEREGQGNLNWEKKKISGSYSTDPDLSKLNKIFPFESLRKLISPPIVEESCQADQKHLSTIIKTISTVTKLESYQSLLQIVLKCKVLKYPSARTSYLSCLQLHCGPNVMRFYDAESTTTINEKYWNRNKHVGISSSLFFKGYFLWIWLWI